MSVTFKSQEMQSAKLEIAVWGKRQIPKLRFTSRIKRAVVQISSLNAFLHLGELKEGTLKVLTTFIFKAFQKA